MALTTAITAQWTGTRAWTATPALQTATPAMWTATAVLLGWTADIILSHPLLCLRLLWLVFIFCYNLSSLKLLNPSTIGLGISNKTS